MRGPATRDRRNHCAGHARPEVVKWRQWHRRLRLNGYVATRNTGRCLEFEITKWKPLRGVSDLPPQKYQKSHTRGGRNDTSRGGLTSLKDLILSRQMRLRPRRKRV